MACRCELRDLSKLNGKKIFVDANILIYLFWPTGATNWENKYASAFARLKKQKNSLFIDFCVVSEVINRVIRIEWNRKQSGRSFKVFRDSRDGQKALSEIYTIVKDSILKNFDIIGMEYNKDDIESFLVVDELDFNDKSAIKICKNNDFILLTHDRDFEKSGIDIITALKP